MNSRLSHHTKYVIFESIEKENKDWVVKLDDWWFQLDKQSVPAHHFVLAQASEEFAQLSRQGSCTHYRLKGVDVQVLNQVLSFAYTHDCAVIHPGPLDSQLQYDSNFCFGKFYV